MATKAKSKTRETGSIDPVRLYSPEELSPLSGIAARRLQRMMDDGRIGFVMLGRERGRRISGKQYLDYIERNSVGPVD